MIRAKDIRSNGILGGYGWEEGTEGFDIDKAITLTRKHVEQKDKTRKCLGSSSKFNYMEENGEYKLEYRVVRIPIASGWECLITNLEREEYPAEVMKELYERRWGVEVLFRSIKEALCLKRVHSKKRENIIQEIYAKLTMYNLCASIMDCEKEILESKKTRNVNLILFFKSPSLVSF